MSRHQVFYCARRARLPITLPTQAHPFRTRTRPLPSSHRRRGISALLVAGAIVGSCTGDTTAPVGPTTVTTSVHVAANFPQLAQNAAFAVLVPFTRVHVSITHVDGSPALDTTLTVASSVRPLSYDFSVKLSASTPTSGERMSLELSFVDTNGTIVFRAGPSAIMIGTAVSSSLTIDAMYAGPGVSANSVQISPRTLNVNAGGNFSFSATAVDASSTTIQNAPIEWVSLDTTRATMSSNIIGVGKAQTRRGTTRIIAQLITGQADTVALNVRPVASSIALVAGNAQTATIGNATAPTLAQPLVVKVIASDSLAIAGVTVNFAALNGGSVAPAIAVTDSNGVAQTSWTLANSVGLQTANASASGLTGSPVTFSATGQASVVNPRPLQLAGYLWELGMRQNSGIGTVIAMPTVLAQALTVSLTSADPTIATVPATVTIPAGASSAFFTLTAHDVIGTTQITASALGFSSASHAAQVTKPQFRLWPPSYVYTTYPMQFYVTAVDAYGNNPAVNQDVVVTLTSLTPSVVAIDSATVTIPAGTGSSNWATLSALAPGTGRITASDARTAVYAYLPNTASIDAAIPHASLNFLNLDLGLGQYFPSGVPLGTPAAATMTVPITHSRSGITTTPSSVVIAQGRFGAAFNVVATATGVDTITISPPGYVPASGQVVVGPGTFGTYFGWPASLRVGDSVHVTIGTFGPVGISSRNVVASTVISVLSNANIQVVSGVPNSAPLTSITVPADADNVRVYIKGVAAGTGSLSLSAPTYTPFTTSTTVTP
jgi:trimeric autotransporter adhesin